MSVSSLDPLRDELPPGVVGEVVCREHLALDEGLQVLDLEVADLERRIVSHFIWYGDQRHIINNY